MSLPFFCACTTISAYSMFYKFDMLVPYSCLGFITNTDSHVLNLDTNPSANIYDHFYSSKIFYSSWRSFNTEETVLR